MKETWRERAKRAMKGRVSQEELADRLGTSQPGVSHWLNNRSQPSLEEINQIADAIGVSRVWLTHGLGFADGPGKELLETVLSGGLTAAELQALAVTAKTFANSKPPALDLAHGNPATAELIDHFVQNADDIASQDMGLLQRQMDERLKKEHPKGRGTDEKKKPRKGRTGT